jgi:RHS repeat-associated protein
LKSVDNGAAGTYYYNALGQRVEKIVGSTAELSYYGGYGELMEYNNRNNPTRNFIWLGSRLLANYSSGTYFAHPQALGSTQAVTDWAGQQVQDLLLYPWGQRWTYAGSLFDERFAGLDKRQGESALDPTPFRFYTSGLGRWLSPDPLAGDILNPQSLNRYAYALNNPTTLTDPLGLDSCPGFNVNNLSWEGDATPLPCGLENNPSGPPPVTITNGSDLSSSLAQGEARYADNFGWLVQGSLYGHNINPTFFSSLDAYFDWRTGLAVQPANEVYGAFASLGPYLKGFDPNLEYTVNYQVRGTTYNIQVIGPDGKPLALDVDEVLADAGQAGTGHGGKATGTSEASSTHSMSWTSSTPMPARFPVGRATSMPQAPSELGRPST